MGEVSSRQQADGSRQLKPGRRLKGTEAHVVNVVHDEVVVECPEEGAEEFGRVVEEAMCAAGQEYVKAVPVKVEAAVTDEWVK